MRIYAELDLVVVMEHLRRYSALSDVVVSINLSHHLPQLPHGVMLMIYSNWV